MRPLRRALPGPPEGGQASLGRPGACLPMRPLRRALPGLRCLTLRNP